MIRMEIKDLIWVGTDSGWDRTGRDGDGKGKGIWQDAGRTTGTMDHFLHFNNVTNCIDHSIPLTHNSSQASRHLHIHIFFLLAYPQQRRFGWVCLHLFCLHCFWERGNRDRSGLERADMGMGIHWVWWCIQDVWKGTLDGPIGLVLDYLRLYVLQKEGG